MTRIKLCGLSREEDISAVNRIMPDYIGFVFWQKSSRYVDAAKAAELRGILDPKILSVGVFVDEEPSEVEKLFEKGIIDIAQLHGSEDNDYIVRLRKNSGKKIIKAFRIREKSDLQKASDIPADYVLLDSGAGGGKKLDWDLLREIKRPYFLAGGLSPDNVAEAIDLLHPFAVDVSSGIETDGHKDNEKMERFVEAVRRKDKGAVI